MPEGIFSEVLLLFCFNFGLVFVLFGDKILLCSISWSRMTVDRLCYHAYPPVQLYAILIENEFGRGWVDKETLGKRQVQMCQHHLGLRQ